MRLAAMAVAAAAVGTVSVLLSLPPAGSTAASPLGAAEGRAFAPASCPPCEKGPMGPIGWMHAAADDAGSLQRAAALSLAIGEPQVVEFALQAEDPALRELAALLLNVASGRVAGCTPLSEGGHVAGVLDRLDRLLAKVRAGEPVPAAELSAAADAAAVLNRGEGLPNDCSG